MPEAAIPLLHIDSLEVRFGAVRALKGVSMDVRQGEVVALVGANGAGKSTTLRTISGLSRPRSGSIVFAGTSIGGRPPAQAPHGPVREPPEQRRRLPCLTALAGGALLQLVFWSDK